MAAFEWLDDGFDGMAGFERMREVAHNFPFKPPLPAATFPPDFVATYAQIASHDPVDYDGEQIYFISPFAENPRLCWYDGLFSPATIQMQNGIIAESNYAAAGAIIMPPTFFAVGSAYEEFSELRLMICLDDQNPQYGAIFAWRLAWEPLGTGDNRWGLAYLAPTLDTFLGNLTTQTVAKAAMVSIDPH